MLSSVTPLTISSTLHFSRVYPIIFCTSMGRCHCVIDICQIFAVGRVLSKGKMSHSYCTVTATFFSFNSVSGNKDKFDLKGRKTRNILKQRKMFSRVVMAFTKGNLI